MPEHGIGYSCSEEELGLGFGAFVGIWRGHDWD